MYWLDSPVRIRCPAKDAPAVRSRDGDDDRTRVERRLPGHVEIEA
jgi:hypothetical protein